MGAPSFTDWNHPSKWRIPNGIPDIPTPAAPPPPADLAAAYFQGIARAKTNQGLRAGAGRASSFLSANSPPPGDAYGAPGSKTTTGS